ncbi:MAG: S4 domain-containing protein [Bacilli bacterium]
MRIDKFLKVSRLVKRRVVSQELLDSKRVFINDKVVKKSAQVKVGDEILLKYGNVDNRRYVKVRVVKIENVVNKDDATTLYEVIGG